jgi:hypothetical protein
VALRWRRRRPELVMAVLLAAGIGFHFIAPKMVLPVAAYFGMWALAAARPPRVSLIGLVGLLALGAATSSPRPLRTPSS